MGLLCWLRLGLAAALYRPACDSLRFELRCVMVGINATAWTLKLLSEGLLNVFFIAPLPETDTVLERSPAVPLFKQAPPALIAFMLIHCLLFFLFVERWKAAAPTCVMLFSKVSPSPWLLRSGFGGGESFGCVETLS